MKRSLGFGLLLVLSSLPLLAANNSHVFSLTSDIRVGDIQLPSGQCDVTWSATSGDEVKLTFKTKDMKTVTIPVRATETRESGFGISTSEVNGVTYLRELRTPKARFIIQDATHAATATK